MTDPSTITAYRPCVGVMLINHDGLVWIGRRFEKQNDDGVGKWWQMPQGGIDEGEDSRRSAPRTGRGNDCHLRRRCLPKRQTGTSMICRNT